MPRKSKEIGLAIVGAGRVGLLRGRVAARHGAVDWIGISEKNPDRTRHAAGEIGADFITSDHCELLRRPEVTAAIIATDEHLHVDPVMRAMERGLPTLIEKPLATKPSESRKVLEAIERAGVDAVVGYTQRFRRRWLAAKEKVRTGALGDVTLITSRAFMNRLVDFMGSYPPRGHGTRRVARAHARRNRILAQPRRPRRAHSARHCQRGS